MADFLLVVPAGWTEVTDYVERFASIGLDAVRDAVVNNDMNALSQMLEEACVIAPNSTVVAGRVIDTADGQRFWYRANG